MQNHSVIRAGLNASDRRQWTCGKKLALVRAAALAASMLCATLATAKSSRVLSDDGVANFAKIARDVTPVPDWNGHGAPAWFHITRERVKPGATEPLLRVHAERAKALRAANWPRNSIVLRPLTGPEEVWTLTGYNEVLALGDENPAMLEKAPELKARLAQLDAEASQYITGKAENIVKHIVPLSFQPDFEWSEVRMLTARSRKIKQGLEPQFAKWNKAKDENLTKLRIPVHKITLKNLYGEEQGVFTQIIPYRSFRDMYLVSEASPDGRTTPEVSALLDGIIEWETLQAYYVDPAASYVTADFATVRFTRTIDPFWGVAPNAVVAGPNGVRETIALDKVPAAARDAIKQSVGSGRLLRVEQVSREGRTHYSVHFWHKPKYFADGRPAIYKVPDVVKTKVQVEDLPAAVQPLVKDEIAVCMHYELNLREGLAKPEYELVMALPSQSNFLSKALIKDVIYDDGGKILAVESQIDLEDVPAVPRELIKQEIGDGELLNVQQLTKDGGTIIYQARIGMTKHFNADGSVVDSGPGTH